MRYGEFEDQLLGAGDGDLTEEEHYDYYCWADANEARIEHIDDAGVIAEMYYRDIASGSWATN
jgi:hypothetical protein